MCQTDLNAMIIQDKSVGLMTERVKSRQMNASNGNIRKRKGSYLKRAVKRMNTGACTDGLMNDDLKENAFQYYPIPEDAQVSQEQPDKYFSPVVLENDYVGNSEMKPEYADSEEIADDEKEDGVDEEESDDFKELETDEDEEGEDDDEKEEEEENADDMQIDDEVPIDLLKDDTEEESDVEMEDDLKSAQQHMQFKFDNSRNKRKKYLYHRRKLKIISDEVDSLEEMNQKENEIFEKMSTELLQVTNEIEELKEFIRNQKTKHDEEIEQLEKEISELNEASQRYSACRIRPQAVVRPPILSNANWNPRDLPENLKPCHTIISKLELLKNIAIFLEPVPFEAFPDYLSVIKKPMCLNDVKKNLFTGVYSESKDFVEDVRLIWRNAMYYNVSSNIVHKWAAQHSRLFEKYVKEHLSSGMKSGKTATFELSSEYPSHRSGTNERALKILSAQITQLTAAGMQELVALLKRKCPSYRNSTGAQLCINLEEMSPDMIAEIQRIVMRKRKKPISKMSRRQRLKQQINELKAENPACRSRYPPPAL